MARRRPSRRTTTTPSFPWARRSSSSSSTCSSLIPPPPGPTAPVPPVRFNQPLGTEVTSGPGRVTFLRVDEDTLRLAVAAQQNAMLLLADEMYPGWSVTVDGRPARIYRADYLFRA